MPIGNSDSVEKTGEEDENGDSMNSSIDSRRQSDLKSVFSHWEVGDVQAIEPIQPDTVFKVTTPERSFILKDISTKWPSERYEFIHDVLVHVAKQGMKTDVPMRNKMGQVVTELRDCRYILSGFLEASRSPTLPDQSRELFYNVGAAIAEFHIALSSYGDKDLTRKTWRENLLGPLDRDAQIELGLSDRQVSTLIEVCRKREEDFHQAQKDLPEQLIHRDCHFGNVIVDGVQVVGFIDCDHLCIGSPIEDLAYFFSDLPWIPKGVLEFRDWLAHIPVLLDGYHRRRALSSREIAVFPYMVMVWLMAFSGYHASLKEFEITASHLQTLVWINDHFDEVLRITQTPV
jgi:Ser/Thr protein kinase RdoA (MazF antagonist)